MRLEILTPSKAIYSGDVYGVQLPGVEGSFEVLENHAAMVAALGDGKMKILKDKNSTAGETFIIKGGFLEVLDNKATVLIESAEAL